MVGTTNLGLVVGAWAKVEVDGRVCRPRHRGKRCELLVWQAKVWGREV